MQSQKTAQWNEEARKAMLGTLAQLAGSPPQWTPALCALVTRTIMLSIAPDLQAVPPLPNQMDPPTLFQYLSEVFHLLRRELDPNVALKRAKLHAANTSHSDAMDVDQPKGEITKQANEDDKTLNESNEVQVLVALNSYFVTIKDQLTVLDGQFPGESKPEEMVMLVRNLHAANWFPTHLLVENLSMPLLQAGGAIDRKPVERMVQQHRTLNLFTLPIYSLTLEAPEGFMNLMVVLSELLQSPLSLPPGADHTHPTVVALADDVWKKVDQIIAIHLLSRARVAETLLRAFSARIATHWPLFLALFVKLQFNQMSQIAGMTLRMMGSHTPGIAPPPLAVEDLDQFRTDTLFSTRDVYLNRLDRTLDAYANDVPKFMGPDPSTTTSTAASAPGLPTSRAPPESTTDRDRSYAATFIDKALNNSGPLLRNMYLAAALLVRHGVVQLDQLLAHFPEPDATQEGAVRMADVVSVPLVDARPSVDPDELMSRPTYLKPPGSKPLANADESTLTPDQVAAKRLAVAIASLLVSMLAIGDVNSARAVMATYPDVAWCTVFPPVAKQVLRVLDTATSKHRVAEEHGDGTQAAAPTVFTAYRRGAQRFFYPAWAAELPLGDLTFIFTLLALVPEHLYLRPAIATRLCALCMERPHDLRDQVGVSIEQMLKQYLLPAMVLGERNVALSRGIWHLIKTWPADRRFALYASMPRDVYGWGAGPLVRAMGDQVDATVRYWMKRISKDVVHTYVRKLGKLALGNPVPVLLRMVATIMSYDNLGTPLLECLRYLDPLGMDVLMYTFLAALSDPAGKANVYVSSQSAGRKAPMLVKMPIGYALKDDGVNLESWWVNTSQFMAAWLSNSPDTDLDPLMAFLDHVNPVDRSVSEFGIADAQLLSDLVASMAGIPVIQDVSAQHIRALESAPCVTKRLLTSSVASSDVFNHHGRKGADPLKVRAHSTQSLVKHLLRHNRASRFLSHLRVLYGTLAQRTRDWDDWDVKEYVKVTDLLAELQWKDRIKAALVQYATFLRLYVVSALPEGDALKAQLDSRARWSLVPVNQVAVQSGSDGETALEQDQDDYEPGGRELFWRMRLYHVQYEPSVYLPEEKEARDQHLADHTQAITMVMNLSTRVEKERKRLREAELAAAATIAASGPAVEAQASTAGQGEAGEQTSAVAVSEVKERNSSVESVDTKSQVTSTTANGADNVDSVDVEMSDVASLASSSAVTEDTASIVSIATASDLDPMDIDKPVQQLQQPESHAPTAASGTPAQAASGDAKKPSISAEATHPDDHINAADDLLPSASDLIRRAAESPADAEYASFWASKVSPAVLLSVVQHAWSIRGMTEFESANVGILIAKALELLQKNADISSSASAAAKAAARRAMRAHTSLFDFFVTVLGSGEEEKTTTADVDDLFFDIKPKPVPADVYLVRNTINLFKALTTARVFPAIYRHGSVLHKALDKLKDNDSLRVLVLVLQGAINEVKSRRYPLERKLTNEPSRRERERDRDRGREDRKRESNGSGSKKSSASSEAAKGDEAKKPIIPGIPSKPTYNSGSRSAVVNRSPAPAASASPASAAPRQPSPGRSTASASGATPSNRADDQPAPLGDSSTATSSLVNHWASVASPLLPARASSPSGPGAAKLETLGLSSLANQVVSSDDRNGRDSGEVTPTSRLSPVSTDPAGSSSPSVWAPRSEVLDRLRESSSTPTSQRGDSQSRRTGAGGEKATKDTEREGRDRSDKDRPSSSRRRSRSREGRDKSGRAKSRSKSPRERRRRSKDRARDQDKRDRGGSTSERRTGDGRREREGTPSLSDRDRGRDRRERRGAKSEREEASERSSDSKKRSESVSESGTSNTKSNDEPAPSRVRPRSDDLDDGNDGPDRKRAKLDTSSTAASGGQSLLSASAASSASSSSANMTTHSSPARPAPPSIPRRPSGPLPPPTDAMVNRAHPSLPPAPAPLRSPPMGPTRGVGASSLRDSYEPDRRDRDRERERDRDRERDRERSSRPSGGDRNRRSYR